MTPIGRTRPVIADNPPMQRMRNSRWSHWVGVILVLLPLLMPTLSHALRHAAALPQAGIGSGAICLPGSIGGTAAAQADGGADTPSHTGSAEHRLHACAYCACPAFGHALPAPAIDSTGDANASDGVGPPVFTPAPRPPLERPRARSPPARA